MYRFLAFLLFYLFINFSDFIFQLDGFLSLVFNLIFVVFYIFKHNNVSKLIKINYSNNLIYGILLIIFFSILWDILIIYLDGPPKRFHNRFDLFFIISIVLISFADEIIFRGYWLEKINKKFKPNFSIFIVSFGSSFLHLFARNNPFLAFFASVVLCLIFTKKASILNVFIVHLISNLFFIFVLPHLISRYYYFDNFSKIIIIVLVFLIFIYLMKLFLTPHLARVKISSTASASFKLVPTTLSQQNKLQP
jgi:membrane protease YdiL (CAAX protease family)